MISKIIVFVLGLAIGAGVCAAILSKKAKTDTAAAVAKSGSTFTSQINELEASLASTKERLGDAQSSNEQLAARVQELVKKEAEARLAASATPTEKEKPKKKGFAALFDSDGTNVFSEAMEGMMKTAAKQQVEGKISGLKAKLNLNSQQEAAIRDILEKQMAKGTELVTKAFSGEFSKEALADLSKEQVSERDQIKALLTPEQASAYEEYEKEERSRMARLAANAEMLQMQSSLQLTTEQQDKVFAVLSDHALGEVDNNGVPKDFDFRKQIDQKKEALRSVLTAEQFERYEKQQEEQLKLIEMFMPKEAKPGTLPTPAAPTK